MKIRETFLTKYPLLCPYITNEQVKNKLMNDEEFTQYYNHYNFSLKTLIYELEKYFDHPLISDILEKLIFNLRRVDIPKFISSYLNSSESLKANKDIIKIYENITELDTEQQSLIEQKGITEEYYKKEEIEEPSININKVKETNLLILNDLYFNCDNHNFTFKEQTLDEVYSKSIIRERQLIIELLNTNSFTIFNEIFAQFNFNLSTLIFILSKYEIDSTILNKVVLTNLGVVNLLTLISVIIENPLSKLILDNLKCLIINNKFNLLNKLIEKQLLDYLGNLTTKQIVDYDDNEIIVLVSSLKLKKN